MNAPEIRRVVTGHDETGRAVIVSDEVSSGPTRFANLVWTTATSPADNMDDADGALREVGVTLAGGSVFRIGRLEPGHRSPLHRTLSVDYGIVLEGEAVLELDGGDRVVLATGDVLIQRGTNHLWANESSKPCTVAWVLIDAEPVVVGGEQLQPISIELPQPDQS
ncbi:cupin domain-containing protein [Streptomyces sp. NBC_00582]|uniref:cupin domain-containing protein n=1 Tax=Streptomyces sp. NBC_00582 TaxID=2975783 RepID=UPI002E8197A0|nr:cupin domain-containing protein [Streptomyces sp. NBC_00582]WUB66050.1 cupin domain-containing protein [Streptomyces sp. NBC_00582]